MSKQRRRKVSKNPKPKQRAAVEVHEVESLRGELERLRALGSAPRWNANPEDVRRSVVKLVLTLIEAIRRMEQNTLSDEETEAIGLALMRLEETIREIGAQFDLAPEDLNLDLGPIGKLV